MRRAFPFSSLGGAGAPAAHDPATDNLSLWLRTDSVTGTTSTLSWASKASAGSSGSAAPFIHSYTDLVTQPATAFDGFSSVSFQGDPTPAILVTTDLTRTTLLGGGDFVTASYTVAYVVRPVSAGQHNVDGGGLYTSSNAGLFGDPSSYIEHILSNDGGVCKFGASHFQDGVGYGGTAPVAWPGNFGTWGLLWMVYTASSTLKMRVKTVGNAAVESTQAIVEIMGYAIYDYPAAIGSVNFSDINDTNMVEIMIWPGQALSPAQITTREQGYFKTRYPSLGL